MSFRRADQVLKHAVETLALAAFERVDLVEDLGDPVDGERNVGWRRDAPFCQDAQRMSPGKQAGQSHAIVAAILCTLSEKAHHHFSGRAVKPARSSIARP